MTIEFKNQKFGLELEFTGITRSQSINVLKQVLNSTLANANFVKDAQDREWLMKYDGSVRAENGGDKNELVTPILTYDDIPLLQEVVRKLRDEGAIVNNSCGIHIHVESRNHDASSTRNFLNLFRNNEDALYSLLSVFPNRSRRYCQKLKSKHDYLFEKLSNRNCDFNDIKNGFQHCRGSAKYSGLNLNKLCSFGFERGTFEFRLFNATLHAGEIRSYITLALKMSAYAINTTVVEPAISSSRSKSHVLNFLNMLEIKENDVEMKNVYRNLTKKFNRTTTQQVS